LGYRFSANSGVISALCGAENNDSAAYQSIGGAVSSLKAYKQKNLRKASILNAGGFRPTGDPFASHFGLKPLALPDETWPMADGAPMMLVCQMNLTNAPAVPELLNGVTLITFFLEPEGPWKDDSGTNWIVRAYNSLDGLVALTPPSGAPSVHKGFEASWQPCDDYPSLDDPDREVPDGFDDSEVELESANRTKIGGWASNIQSEPWWEYRDHAAAPKYCFQVASEQKVGLQWGDGGTIYIGRGTAPGFENQWFLDWQCY
jgi:hypothetical protein